MKFLLDTDTCIDALKQHRRIIEHLLAAAREDVAVSVITEAELRTGAAKSSSPSKTLRAIENFLAPISRLDFTSEDAIACAVVRSKLERAGNPIGPLDTLIAAQAVARDLVVVSNNEREFRRVAGLKVETCPVKSPPAKRLTPGARAGHGALAAHIIPRCGQETPGPASKPARVGRIDLVHRLRDELRYQVDRLPSEDVIEWEQKQS